MTTHGNSSRGARPLSRPAGQPAALPLGVAAGALLLAVAMALLAAGWRESAALDVRPDLVDFFPAERNAAGEYRFAYPEAGLFWARALPRNARLTLAVQSPPPLPARELALSHGGTELLRVAVGEERRTLRLLLPPGDPALAGYAIGLSAEGAAAPGDERRLGLLFTEIRLDTPTAAMPMAAHLGAAALVTAGAALALSLGLGGAAAGLLGLLLVLLFRADAARFWPLAAGTCGALAAVRLALPRPVMDWAERRPALSLPAWAAAGVGALFTGTIGWYALANHALYGTNGYDLGLYDQTFWLISRLLPSYSTGAGINMVGSHAAIVLYPIAALYWLVADVRALLLLQTLAAGLAAAPLYLIGHDRGRPWLGVATGAAYLAHPATQNMALFDFHVDTIAATALLFALWAAESRRWRLFLACCALVILCKENFAVTIAWLGLWLMLLRRQWRVGALLIGCSAAWFLFSTQVLVPMIIGKEESLHVSRFARYGDSIPAILAFALANPLVVLGDMLAPGWEGYLLALLAPFALLPLLSPVALLALPPLAINLLSSFEGQRTLIFHYNSLIVALFAAAALDAACRLAGWAARVRSGGQPAALAGTAATWGLAALLLGGAWLGQGVSELRRDMVDVTAAREGGLSHRRDYVLSHIPAGAAVAAHSNFHPHLSQRRQAFIFPNPFIPADFYSPEAMPFEPRVEYVVVDTRRIGRGSVPAEAQLELLDALVARGLYRRTVDLGGIVLLERSGDAPGACYGPGWRAEGCLP